MNPFTIKKEFGYRVKRRGYYKWGSRGKKLELFPLDVLTKADDGTYIKQNGIGCIGIVLADDEVEHIDEDKHLCFAGGFP